MSAPECQLSNCEAEAARTADHPRFGEVQVCATCAALFEVASDD
jgi:hypothetical protein